MNFGMGCFSYLVRWEMKRRELGDIGQDSLAELCLELSFELRVSKKGNRERNAGGRNNVVTEA